MDEGGVVICALATVQGNWGRFGAALGVGTVCRPVAGTLRPLAAQ